MNSKGAIREPSRLGPPFPKETRPASSQACMLSRTSPHSYRVRGLAGLRKAQIRKRIPGICLPRLASKCPLFPSLPFLTEDLSHKFCKKQVLSQANPLHESSARPRPASVLEVWTSNWRWPQSLNEGHP